MNKELRQKIYDILNVHKPDGSCGHPCPAVTEFENLIAQREKLARIDEQERYLKMLESGKWRSFGIEITERLTTLRKELDGGQK